MSASKIEPDKKVFTAVAHDKLDQSHVGKSVGKLAWIGLAACLVSGVGIGALGTHFFLQQSQISTAKISEQSIQMASVLKHDRLVKRIADYQSLYVENTVANIAESQLDNATRLLQSINNRSNIKSSIPDFSSFGYQFVRAQELGFEGQILVQLVYKKSGVTPLAFCFMLDDDISAIELNLSKHQGLNTASWVTDSQHYVLVGDESQAAMTKMYEAASIDF